MFFLPVNKCHKSGIKHLKCFAGCDKSNKLGAKIFVKKSAYEANSGVKPVGRLVANLAFDLFFKKKTSFYASLLLSPKSIYELFGGPGKTGTTELFTETGKTGEHIASFVGAFPANDPDYVILIVVDKPTSGYYYGSIVATPYAKMVFEVIIKYKNIQPSENLDSDLNKLEKNIEMPNLVGKSLSQAVGIITNLGLQYELDGEGGVVKAQYPAPTTMMYKNGIVVIST